MTLLTSTHAMVIAGSAPDWVQLLPLGKFSGRDGRGPYRIADLAAAQKIVAATLERAGGADLPIDYDHQSDFAAVPGVGGTAPAAGWIKELEAREDGIWARAEWTATAAEKLRGKEYRYISPVFTSRESDGLVGTILRAGLTNNPNLDLVAVAAAQQGADMSFAKKVAAALAMAEDSDEEAILAAVKELADAHSEGDDEKHSDEEQHNEEKQEEMRQALAKVAAAAGLSATKVHGVETIVAAVQAARKPDPAKFVPADQVVQLQTQLSSLQKERAEEKAEAAVSAAIKAGKIVPGLRDWALSLHQSDPTAFAAYVAGAPAIVDGGVRLPGPPGGGEGELSAEEKQVCRALGVDEEAFRKTEGIGR